MKKRYFLRGLGAGILLTALVLCASYRQNDSEQSVVERAQKLGMQFPEKTSDTLLTASGAALAVSPSPSVRPDRTKEPSAQPTQTAKTTEKAVGKTKTFEVREGLLSSSVAQEMRKAGIIKSADDFDEYLEKTGMARKICAGKYKIPKGAGYEEIAKIITRQ